MYNQATKYDYYYKLQALDIITQPIFVLLGKSSYYYV